MTYLSVLRHSATIILAFTVSNLSKWAPRALNYRRSGVACVPPSAKFAIIKRPSTLNWSWLWGKGALAQFSVCSTAERLARPHFVPSFSLADAHYSTLWPRIEKRRARTALLYSVSSPLLLSDWPQPKLFFGSQVKERLRAWQDLWRHLPNAKRERVKKILLYYYILQWILLLQALLLWS